jgi:hypothetical protein
MDNPNSLLQSICQARENARMVRDQITLELWEELNRLYLFVRSPYAREVWRRSAGEFFRRSSPARSTSSASLTPRSSATKAGGLCGSASCSSARTRPRASSMCATKVCPNVACRSASARRGARMVGGAALVQRVGRLQDHPRRRRASAAGGGISFIERRFSALRPLLRERIESGVAPYFRRGRRPFHQRRRKAHRPFSRGTAIQHHRRNFRRRPAPIISTRRRRS